MNKNIYSISGYSCSGKTTLIKSICKDYDFDVIQFGLIHKECVKNSGYSYAKDWIREKGFSEYEEKLIELFGTKINSYALSSHKDLIIDGIFSKKCYNYLEKIKNINLKNIVLNTDFDTRINRMMKREKLSYEKAREHLCVTDCIKEHAGLSDILRKYDYIINKEFSVIELKDIFTSILLQNQKQVER